MAQLTNEECYDLARALAASPHRLTALEKEDILATVLVRTQEADDHEAAITAAAAAAKKAAARAAAKSASPTPKQRIQSGMGKAMANTKLRALFKRKAS